MDQHQSVHFAERNQARSNGSLAKGCRCTKDTFIVSRHSLGCLYLGRSAVAVELNLKRNSAEPMICNLDRDAMALAQIEYFLQQAPRQGDMMNQVFSASDDAEFAKSRESHRLCLIKLRILKCSQAHQAIQEHIGQVFLFDKNHVANFD